YLQAGQPLVIVASYSVTDSYAGVFGSAGSIAQKATITITGTNDIPTVASALSRSSAEGDNAYELALLSGLVDLDTADTHTVQFITYAIDGAAPSAVIAAGLALNGT